MKRLKYEADVKNWLARADQDLEWTRVTLRSKFYMQACFVAQQVAEKALKAFLLSYDAVPPKTHSLPRLLQDTLNFEDGFKKFKNEVEILDKYYAPTRYPDLGVYEDFSLRKAEEALKVASHILNFVKSAINFSSLKAGVLLKFT